MTPRYLEDHGDHLILRPCAEDHLARGALLAFVAAPLALAAAMLGAAIAAGDDGLALAIGWGVGALLGAALAVTGLVTMLGAQRRELRGFVRLDLAERLLERRGRAPEVLRAIAAVAVRRVWSGWRIELVHADQRRTELLRVPRGEGHALAESAEHLADALGVTADVPSSAHAARPLLPRDPRVAAALAYVPIEGAFVAASTWYLMTSRDPFVRFHAKQSLALLGLSAIAAVALLGCCGLPMALLMPRALWPVGLARPLALLLVVRIGVRVVAALRAHRGAVWIMPWLAPLARRWAPPPPASRGRDRRPTAA